MLKWKDMRIADIMPNWNDIRSIVDITKLGEMPCAGSII